MSNPWCTRGEGTPPQYMTRIYFIYRVHIWRLARWKRSVMFVSSLSNVRRFFMQIHREIDGNFSKTIITGRPRHYRATNGPG